MKKRSIWHKDFTLMILGQIISLFGNVALRFALSLFVLDITGSAAVFGGVLAVSMIPTILFSPIGGVLADRISRKNIMVALDFTTSVLILLFSFTIHMDSVLIFLSILMIMLSLIQSFYQPSVQASIPALVGNENLMAGNSIAILINAVANLAGPILGGILYGILGIKPILFICTICFFSSAVMEIFIKIPFIPEKSAHGIIKTTVSDLKTGFKFMIRENKLLIKALLTVSLINLTLSSFMIVGLPYIVKIFLGLSDQHYGFLQAAMGVGTILGGMVIGSLGRRIKPSKCFLFLIPTALLAVPMGLAALNNSNPVRSYVIILISTILCMACSGIYSIIGQTCIQQLTPPSLMGKVSSLVTTLVGCSMPVGQAIYGLLFDKFSENIPAIAIATAFLGLIIAFLAKNIFNWYDNNSADEFREKVQKELDISASEAI